MLHLIRTEERQSNPKNPTIKQFYGNNITNKIKYNHQMQIQNIELDINNNNDTPSEVYVLNQSLNSYQFTNSK
jgi:hypothetical protein